MLTVELKTAKNMDLSKSSLMDDENDLRSNTNVSHRA